MTALPPLELGPMPEAKEMSTVDEQVVRAPMLTIFSLAANVEQWPSLLPHYRYVRFEERRRDGGGIVDMSANRPFGIVQWPTRWKSKMRVYGPGNGGALSIRFAHIEGVTRGMEVEWTFSDVQHGTHVRIVHVWDGPAVPVVGTTAATFVIGPVFVHGIASRTLAGLASHAERAALGAGG